MNAFRVFFRRLDLRLHRKIIAIDDEVAYTGSMNMVDPEYLQKRCWRRRMDRRNGSNNWPYS